MQEKNRIEKDSLGFVEVPFSALWGAQTQRSINNFSIGEEIIPIELIYSLTLIKKAAAISNYDLGYLEESKKELIVDSCREILEGNYNEQFPLKIWQTGSGTHTNMNVNEVISNIASKKSNFALGSHQPLHPNDDVNKSQSTNDTFPTAIQIAVVKTIVQNLLPIINKLIESLDKKSSEWKDTLKIGRTHFQDAVPMSLGQEVAAWSQQIKDSKKSLEDSLKDLFFLPLGGTAVGTGINCPEGFSQKAIEIISKETNLSFKRSTSPYSLMASHDRLANVMCNIKNLASTFFKISNDIKILSSGPRCGIYELKLPKNEPGSSIMPGKVNPTQCESLSMICTQIIGLEHAVSLANCSGTLQMNEYKPLIGYNILTSISLMTNSLKNFREKLIDGMVPNYQIIQNNLESSLMLVTALVPKIGYEKAADIANLAFKESINLKDAAIKLGYLSEEVFNSIIEPDQMI